MSFLKSLYQSAKQKIEDVFLGEPVKEWGDIFEQQQRFFTEVISIDLYRKNDKLLLWLKVTQKSALSYNVHGYTITFRDLRSFTERLQSRYNQLCRLARARQPVAPRPRDRLPFMFRLMLKPIFGIRASILLLEQRDALIKMTDYRIYGFVTRKSETKVLILSDVAASKKEGTVISGDGFAAVLKVLAEFLDSEESANLLSGPTSN